MTNRNDQLLLGSIWNDKKVPKCCPNTSIMIVTEDSETITFSGDGTVQNPLTATATGGGGGSTAIQGLSVEGTDIVLGQAEDAVGNPALISSNRVIPFDNTSGGQVTLLDVTGTPNPPSTFLSPGRILLQADGEPANFYMDWYNMYYTESTNNTSIGLGVFQGNGSQPKLSLYSDASNPDSYPEIDFAFSPNPESMSIRSLGEHLLAIGGGGGTPPPPVAVFIHDATYPRVEIPNLLGREFFYDYLDTSGDLRLMSSSVILRVRDALNVERANATLSIVAGDNGMFTLNNTLLQLASYTTAQVTALPGIEATVVYDTTINKLKFYNGTAWETITSA